MATIKEKLKEILIENRDTLLNGESLHIQHQGTSPGYIKLAIYVLAKQLGLDLTVSIKDTYVEIKNRENMIKLVTLATVPQPVADADDNDLELEDIFRPSEGAK